MGQSYDTTLGNKIITKANILESRRTLHTEMLQRKFGGAKMKVTGLIPGGYLFPTNDNVAEPLRVMVIPGDPGLL